MFAHLLLASIMLFGAAWPAHAQIYAWRDANGNLVLSDKKGDPSAASYAVPAARRIRTTRATSTTDHGRFEPIIREHAERNALEPDLVRAVIQVESGFNPKALSPKGAMGLMQLMPATAVQLGVDDPWDAEQNIRGGTVYLRQLLDRYHGNEQLALAAYNAGPGAVDRAGQRVPRFRETQDYVKKVGAASGGLASTSTLPPRPKAVIYKVVEEIEGRVVTRYSTERPPSGPYETIRP